jgi:hypothetical protein
MRKEWCLITGIVIAVAFLAGCGEKPAEVTQPTEFLYADGYNGGMLYDKFWAEETGYVHPDTVIFKRYSAFFRCRQCHGWDLLGRVGAYANYNPSKYSPNAAAVNLYATAQALSETELFSAIKTGSNPALRRSTSDTSELSTYDPSASSAVRDRMPNYSTILSDTYVWDIVKFLKTEAVNCSLLYDFTVEGIYPTATVTYANIGKDGNAAQGKVIFDNECGSLTCHGPDGSESAGMMGSIGKHLRSIPFMDGHIIKFGYLGTKMEEEHLTDQQLKDLFKALADSTLFP